MRHDEVAVSLPKTKTVNKASFKDAPTKQAKTFNAEKGLPAVVEKVAEPTKLVGYGAFNNIIMGTLGVRTEDDPGMTRKLTKAEKAEQDRKLKKIQEYNGQIEKLKKALDIEQYARISCENPKEFVRGVKLTKVRFRQFLQ